jgi:hypothetical protein
VAQLEIEALIIESTKPAKVQFEWFGLVSRELIH